MNKNVYFNFPANQNLEVRSIYWEPRISLDFKYETLQGMFVADFLVRARATLRPEHKHLQFDRGWHKNKKKGENLQ